MKLTRTRITTGTLVRFFCSFSFYKLLDGSWETWGNDFSSLLFECIRYFYLAKRSHDTRFQSDDYKI